MGWSGGVVASVSVWMPWSGRVDPNGLVRPEWVGPEGLLRACRFGCLGADESTRMGWSGRVVASVSVGMPWAVRADPNGLVRARFGFVHFGSRRPFPACFSPALRAAAFRALFRCLLCLARTSLHPGVAFLCFGLLPSVLCFAVSYASPAPPCTRALPPVAHGPLLSVHGPALSCSSARSFLPFGLHSLTPSCTLHPPAPSCSFAHAFLRFGPLPLALLTLPALLPVQKKTPEGLAFGGFRLLSVANYFARAFRLTSLAALSASFGFFEMALLSCASAAVRSPSLTAMTARR